jgi:hypothetical protein
MLETPDTRTPRSLDALAALIAVNVTPLAGIALLGWSPAAVLISYFADTFLGFGALVLLVMLHVTGDEHGRPIAGWKNWAKAVIGLGILGAIMAVPLSFPLWMTIGDDPATWALFSDRGFLGALAVQCLMSALAVVRMHRQLTTRSDDDRVLARRAIFLAARWIAMFVAMVTGLVPVLGPTIGGLILVAIYAAASVYFELFPERAERFLRGKDAKPITFEGDLESQIATGKPGSPSAPQHDKSTTAGAAKKS